LALAVGEGSRQPERICQLCVELIDVAGAGISMVTQTGNRGAVCATDDVASMIEQLQFSLGEGPCVDAVNAGRPVLIPDLGEPHAIDVSRWPAFMSAAADAGIRAVFAFPLAVGAVRVGALDLYRTEAGELSAEQLAGALLAADAAAIALLSLDVDAADTFSGNSADGADYHLDVHRATGMVQEQLGVPTADALLRLRAKAFADDRPISDVAADVIARRLRFDVEES
jgi:GAF domain-containing protein